MSGTGRAWRYALALWVSFALTCARAASPELQWQVARDPQAALRVLEARLEAPARSGDAEQRAEWAGLAASAALLLTDPDRALAAIDKGLPASPEQIRKETWWRLLMAQAAALDLSGRTQQGLDLLAPVMPVIEQHGDTQLLAQALYTRGLALFSLQDFPAALADLNRAYLLAPAVSPVLAKGDVAGGLALVFEQRDEHQEARRWFEESAAYCREHKLTIGLSMATFGLGRASARLGDPARAEQWFAESAELAAQVGDRQGIAYAEKERATLALHRGDLAAVRQHTDNAMRIAEETNNPAQRIDLYLQRAELFRLEKNVREAEAALASAFALAETLGAPLQKAVVEEGRARLYESRGDHRRALEAFRRFHTLRETALQRDSDRQLAGLRARFDLERESQKVRELENQNALNAARLVQQNQRLWLSGGLAAGALVLLLLALAWALRSRQLHRRMDRLAHTDELTGLPNRRHVLDLAERALQSAKRQGQVMSVAVIDLDHFKQINDRYGHPAGDAVLRAFAQTARQTLREQDLIGRIGGEEFFAVFPNTALVEAEAIAERLRLLAREISCPELQGSGKVSISVGMTCVGAADTGILATLARADRALYAAKHGGRDQVQKLVLEAVNG